MDFSVVACIDKSCGSLKQLPATSDSRLGTGAIFCWIKMQNKLALDYDYENWCNITVPAVWILYSSGGSLSSAVA
jgi:hypothetical protein